jgi:hypothetical protein
VAAASAGDVAQDLGQLRAQAQEQNATWRQAPGQDTGPSAIPASLAGVSANAQSQGWVAIDGGDLDAARTRFEQALWVDPDNPDAWLGRAFSSGEDGDAVAFAAVALLMSADAQSARASAIRAIWRKANGDRERLRALEALLREAAAMAETLRPSLPPGTVRLAEPISWADR